MEKDPQELELQLNNNEAPVEQYDLEDIMREFGGWTQREEPEEIELLWKPRKSPKRNRSRRRRWSSKSRLIRRRS